MLAVDRGAFAENAAYKDSPQLIGFGVTISAPHMHAMCLEVLACAGRGPCPIVSRRPLRRVWRARAWQVAIMQELGSIMQMAATMQQQQPQPPGLAAHVAP